ncbi:MAG TPA: hypothetical protein VFG69_15310 [Nannocystaceae bacterium]|nr:hypothetical protein [Nannocystaceae bacterium]
MGKTSPVAVAALVLAACTGEHPHEATETATDSQGSIVTVSASAGTAGDETASAGTATGSADTGSAATGNADSSDGGLKFDLVAPDEPNDTMVDEGCTKVDFLFVIDNSNSMATNQGELVASFPEFVAAIESTLTEVESFHVGVVTSDAYQFNAPGCTAMGALVTQTGGVNSSNAVCNPFADGFRYMTDADDLDNDFACAALVGTAGANDEQMMAGALGAISDPLNMAGGCNDGFLRDDALLVAVFISDEDDPGSSLVGSPGDPNTWLAAFVAAKGVVENTVVLTLTRGSPGNVCGGAQGSEVDGTRLMQFAQLFGANGFMGDICAASFGPFFDGAVDVIASACDNFEPPR